MKGPAEVLFLVVGRGGSKGLPGKNLREIRGEAHPSAPRVLFSRPAELATDTASSNDVILHAMDWIETHERRRYDAIMLLEPSSPFARPEHFDQAVELFVARKASLVVGIRETEVASIFVGPPGS